MKQSSFFALIDRLRYINRWSLMRSGKVENVSEHSFQTAYIAHALALIGRDVFGGRTDPERVCVAALYHDAAEVLTGDLPTPVKYMNPDMRHSYKAIEKSSRERMLSLLPSALEPSFRPVVNAEEEDPAVYRYVRAADKLSAYIKCVEERNMGSREFLRAEKQLRALLDGMDMPEAAYFIETFLSAYEGTIDDIGDE